MLSKVFDLIEKKTRFFNEHVFCTVVIDYRNDPKASTGSFEMIYRQVIPPAPAYLGLNLCLKGTPLSSKNGGSVSGAKRETKPKVDTKPRSERRNSQLIVKMGAPVGASEKTPILSPRSLLIDFNDLNNNTKRRNSSMTKSNTENMLKNGRAMCTATRMRNQPPKQGDQRDPLSCRRPVVAKIPDSSRRHASCGPKLMSMTAPHDNGKSEAADVIENDRKNIKCVGNKVEITDTDKPTSESNKSSPRKPPQDAPSLNGIRAKLKPSTAALPKSAMDSPYAKDASPATAAPNDYRKLLTRSSLQLNRLPNSKHPNHSYNSHFYAVGLSLRAWKSKYNRMKENTATTPTSITAVKGKIN